jgi:hypothetical protein
VYVANEAVLTRRSFLVKLSGGCLRYGIPSLLDDAGEEELRDVPSIDCASIWTNTGLSVSVHTPSS